MKTENSFEWVNKLMDKRKELEILHNYDEYEEKTKRDQLSYLSLKSLLLNKKKSVPVFDLSKNV